MVGGGMRVIGRLLVALAVAFPLMVALAGVADGATGPSVLDCSTWKDGMRISPGVGNTPANQTVSAHGRLYGCNKAGEGGQFSATLQMSQATCADLSMSGTASFDWVSGAHSTAYLQFHPQPPSGVRTRRLGTTRPPPPKESVPNSR